MRPIDLGSLQRILIVKPSSLGDVVHTLPFLWLLRKECPDAEIRWLVNSVWAPLLRDHPLLDGLIEFPRQDLKGWNAPGRLVRWLQSLDWQPDLAVDVQGLLRSALLAGATRARRTIGYSDAREGAHLFHGDQIDVSIQRSPHAVDRYLTFFESLGIPIPEEVEFPLHEGRAPAVASALPGRFVAIHPYSRGKGKSLTRSQVEDLAALLPVPAVILGRSGETALNLPDGSLNWLNQTTLEELIWVLRRAAWVVSVDSGPMHLAAAVNPSVLAIHTWSDPRKVGPYSPGCWIWKGGRICPCTRETLPELESIPFPGEAVRDVADFVSGQLRTDPIRP